MAKWLKGLKRGVAALLAVCMTISSFSGVAWGAETDEAEEDGEAYFKLNTTSLLTEAENTIRSGMMYDESFDMSLLSFTKNGDSEAENSYDSLFHETNGLFYELDFWSAAESENDADNAWMDSIPDGASLRIFVQADGEEAAKAKAGIATDSDAKTASDSDAAGEEVPYDLTGQEKIIFLYINSSDADMIFNVQIGNRYLPEVKVVSRTSLLANGATKSNAEKAVMPGSNPGTSVPAAAPAPTAVPETKTEAPTAELPTESPAETGAASTEATSEAVGESTAEAGTNITDSTNTTDRTNEVSVTDPAAEGQTAEESLPKESESEKSTEGSNKEATTAEEKATEENTSEEKSAEAEKTAEAAEEVKEEKTEEVKEEKTEEAKEEKSEAEQPEEAAETEEEQPAADEPEITMSRYMVPRVGTPTAGEVYDGEAKTPEEEYNMKHGRDAWDNGDGDDEDEEEFSGDSVNGYVTTIAEDTDGSAAIESMVYGAVKMEEERTGIARFLRFSSRSDSTARAVVVPVINLSEDTSTGKKFSVNLYDYDGIAGDNTGSLGGKAFNSAINKRLLGNVNNVATNTDILRQHFTFGISGSATDNGWYNGYWAPDGSRNNILQGIVADTRNEDKELVFQSIKKGVDPVEGLNLFPTTASKSSPIWTYLDVYAENFFTADADNANHYTFDSRSDEVKLVDNKLIVTKKESGKSDGLWPLDGYNVGRNQRNYFYGMHVNFNFALSPDGRINDEDMIFSFSGDDDVWVYLTKAGDETDNGRLALDIGGIHDAMNGHINFATGVIDYGKGTDQSSQDAVGAVYNPDTMNFEVNKDSYGKRKYTQWYLYTPEDAMNEYNEANPGYEKTLEEIKQMYGKFVGLERGVWNEYSLDFYYMERGGYLSNCMLDFNMQVLPDDEIMVTKQVQGSRAGSQSSNTAYPMELYVDDELMSEFSLKADESVIFKVPKTAKTYYVKETDSKNATATIWSVGTQKEMGNTSSNGKVGVDKMLICTNVYDSVQPIINKKAELLDEEAERVYDVSLTVEGDSVTISTEQPDEQKLASEDLANAEDVLVYSAEQVKAVDQLSKYVDFYLDNEGKPMIWMNNEQMIGKKDNNFVKYEKDGSIIVIDLKEKTIAWSVEENQLAAGDIRTLTYRAAVTDEAVYRQDSGAYPDVPDSDTGTHAENGREKGYYSNIEATLSYRDPLQDVMIENVKFPHPVIRPAQLPNGSLEIKKILKTGSNVKGEFRFLFNVKLENPDGSPYGNSIPTSDGNTLIPNDGTVEFYLTPGDSLILLELPVGVKYTVTEDLDAMNLTYYQTELQGIEAVSGNGAVTGNEITGTIEAVYSSVGGKWYQTTYNYDLPASVVTNVVMDPDRLNMLNQKFDGKPNEDSEYRLYYYGKDEEGTEQKKEPIPYKGDKLVVHRIDAAYQNGGYQIKALGNFPYQKNEEFGTVEEAITFLKSTYAVDKSAENLEEFLKKKKDFYFYIDTNVKEKATLGRIYMVEEGGNLYSSIKAYYETMGYTVKEATGQTDKGSNFMYKLDKRPAADKMEVYKFAVEKGVKVSQDQVTFTNSMTLKTASLQIKKNITKADPETPTFFFQAENVDFKSPSYGQTFYLSVTMGSDEVEKMSEVLNNIPVGMYKITEFPNMRYQCVSPVNGSINTEVKQNETLVVEFTNEKDSTGYFSKTDVVINTVVENGDGWKFEPQNTDGTTKTLPSAQPQKLDVALLPDKTKSFDDPDNFGDDVPFALC